MKRRIGIAIALIFILGVAFMPEVSRAAAPVVKTVPWVATNPLIPHDTWSGKTTTLKGTTDVQGAGFTYTWDFGDGSPVATGTVTNRYAVQASHAYTGPAGTVFTARLTVQNTGTGETGSKEYFVEIRDKTLPIEVNIAIDEALWYLYKAATRSGTQYSWSNVYYCGDCQSNSTASALQAFLANGHLESGDQSTNPYVEAVRGGIDYLFTRLYVQAMSTQAGGVNPDSNGNGIGLSVNSTYPIYETGAVMDALIATGTPNATARTGPANVIGRTYKAIVQDLVDMYAWGQWDYPYSGSYLGGWRYSWNSDSDNSAAQWGAIGMIPAERKWGCIVPQWVKDRNNTWLNYSYNPAGYFGYQNQSPNRALSTGPCGMVQLSFDGKDVTDPRWVGCENYLKNNWSSFISAGRDARYYSYYAFAKAMRLALPTPVTHLSNGLDWYGDNVQGLARLLVNTQNTSGYWPYDNWPYVGEQTAAAWCVIILGRTLFEAGSPVAVAQAVPNPGVAGQVITLSGSASYHQDPSKSIDSWEWDLNNDGIYDATGPVITTAFTALADYPIKLRVTDNGTPEQSAETIVTVRITIPPVAPTADAGGPYTFCPNRTPWFLDGTGSTNPDDGESEPGKPGDFIKEFVWDLDGDGQFDDAPGAQPDVTSYFAGKGPGAYLVQLRVTDNTAASFPSSGYPDLSDSDSAQVFVKSAADPICTTSCVSNLAARAKLTKIQLTWKHIAGTHHYNVYRSTVSGGPYTFIGSTTSTYSLYLDKGPLTNGTTYYYVVRQAQLSGNEVCQSNQASARAKSRAASSARARSRTGF